MKSCLLFCLAALTLATTVSRMRADEKSTVTALFWAGADIKRDLTQPDRPVLEVRFEEAYEDSVRDEQLQGKLKGLFELKHLRSLTIHSNRVTDAGLSGLGRLKNLESLNLGACLSVTDATLKEIAGLTELRTLDLSFTSVTSQGFKQLTGLKKLRSLNLNGMDEIRDIGMKELAGLKQLHSLSLWQVNVTDVGLKQLAGLKRLRSLNLSFNPVTDEGLKALAGMKDLQMLDLCLTGVTDTGLRELAGLKELRSINLNSTEVTDAGLKELAGLNELQTLDLSGTQVTDAELKELAALHRLRELNLHGTSVTVANAAKLRSALPNCEIKYDRALTSVTAKVEPATARRGETVKWVLEIDLGDGWHTFPTKQPDERFAAFTNKIDFPKPGDVVFVGELKEPPATIRTLSDGSKISELKGQLMWQRSFVVNPRAKPGKVKISVPVTILTNCPDWARRLTVDTELTISDAAPVKVDPKFGNLIK